MKHNFKYFACLFVAILCFGQVWAVDYDLVYTLDGTVTSGGNSNYAQDGGGLTQNGIDWSVTGNTTINPWRIGGKNLSSVDRLAYSKTAIAANIAKIEIEHGTINLTVNSMKVEVASNSDFSTIISEFTPTCSQNKTVEITRPDNKDWSNSYYRITYNVTAGGSNTYVQLKSVKFYKEKSASDPVLESITITGNLTNKIYEEGENIDFAGLTATGNYNDESTADLTDDVEWSFSPALTKGLTSVTVTATLDEISGNKEISGLTVAEHVVTPGTYDIPMTNALWGTSYSGTASGETEVSGKSHDVTITLTKGGSTNMYISDTESRAYASFSLVIGVPTGYVITAMTFTKGSNWNCSTTTGTLSGQSWTGTANSIAFSFGGRTDFKAVSVTYALDVKYAINFSTPANGTLVINDGSQNITSGAEYHEGDEMTVTATPAEGYKLDGIKVIETGSNPENDVTSTVLSGTTLTVPAHAITVSATFVENEAPLVTSYVLSEIGVETSHLNGERVGDKVNLPSTAATCSKTFMGWSENASCAVAPEYAPGAEYTLKADNKLYAVYATPAAGSGWNVATSVTAGDVVVISTNTGYTANPMKTAGAISSSIFGATASTYGSENAQITELAEGTMEFTVGGNATDGWTLMNGTKYLKVTAAKKVGLVDDAETWTISFSGNNATLAPKAGDYTAYSIQYNYNTGNDRFTAYNTTQVAISLYKQVAGYSNYSTDCQAAVATPTFSPAAGTYTSAQSVTISTETADATIYYTTNGDAPTTSSTLYEGAITVDESKTLKAIAVKSGMSNSAVATAAYTINLPLSTIDQVFAAATAAGSTATDANIKFNNWVVSGVSTNGKNVYVTDGTKGFIIFDTGGEMGFAVGNILSGTVTCKVQLYKGAAELTTLSSSTEGLNVATGGTVTPVAKAISALGGINTGAPVTINSVQFDGTNLSDGANEIKPYNSLFAYDALENGKYYNVTGIYLQFDATKEILPRSADDIAEVNLADPEISYTPASATIELGQSLPGTTFANPHELAISYSSNNESVATVSNTGVIALGSATGTAVITASFAGDATYAAANATYTITVNPASVSENVVVLAEHNSKFYAMTTTITNETAVPVEVEYDGTKVTVAKDADKDAIQWTKKTIGENITFQTKDEDKLYLKGTSGGATLSLNATACNWAWDGTNNCYVTGTRGFIYRISTNGFKNYGVSNLSNADYVAPQVIVIDPANIVVTEKADAELAYTPAEVTLTVGGEFTPAVLGYAEGFDGLESVTYASNNEDVATVDESGVVSLVTDAIGTATITATFPGNTNYQSGSASYTITVNEPGDDLTGTWTLASSVAAGDQIIIGGTKNADTYTMGKQNSNNRAAVASELNGTTLTPGAATKVFTLVDAGDSKFAIKTSDNKYLTSATSGTSNNLLEAANYDLDNAKWTISIDGNGVASIVAAAGSKTVMQYNGGSTLFSCYGSASQTNVNIYKKESATPPTPDYGSYPRNGLTVGNYGTICLPNGGTISGAKLFDLEYYDGANTLYFLEVNGNAMEAGRPYIFLPSATTIEVTYTDNANASAGSFHGLVGSYTQEEVVANEGNYILYQNKYYLVNSKAYVGANRAYIHMASVPTEPSTPQVGQAPRRRISMGVQGEQVATGILDIETGEQPMKVMMDGKLYIIRAGQMYDMTGSKVK